MVIELKLSHPLRKHAQGYFEKGTPKDKMDLPEGAAINDVLEILNLSYKGTLLFQVNGTLTDPKNILCDGDVLYIHPLMNF